ncbi:19798_t:CDS:2, partial [Racocetra persica]
MNDLTSEQIANHELIAQVLQEFRELYESKETPAPETKPTVPTESPLERPAPKPLSEQTQEDLV